MSIFGLLGQGWNEFWYVILIQPLINILLAFYHLALFLQLPGPLGWSIIFLTILVRLVVYPIMSAQLRGQQKMYSFRPQLAEIKKKHGHDRKRHEEEKTKFFKEQGYNPASGCLPSLIQIPVLIGLYNVFFSILNGHPEQSLNHLNTSAYFSWLHLSSLNETFLGLNLSLTPAHFGLMSWYVLILIVTALIQLIYTLMTLPPALPKSNSKDEPLFEDALASFQSNMFFLFPLLTGWISYTFPLGLALYWNVANIFAIIQQYLIAGPGGLSKWLPKSLIPKK